MTDKIRIFLRGLGLVLVIAGGVILLISAARSMQSQEYKTPNGFAIEHQIEIPRVSMAVGIAGAALFAISFIRGRRPRDNANI